MYTELDRMEYLSSIVFHTVILKMFLKEVKEEMWSRFYLEKRIEHLSSIVFHTVLLKCFKKEQIYVALQDI